MHEDYLMKMFMATLEGDARSWYEGLPSKNYFPLLIFIQYFMNITKTNTPPCCRFKIVVRMLKVSLDIWKTCIVMMS